MEFDASSGHLYKLDSALVVSNMTLNFGGVTNHALRESAIVDGCCCPLTGEEETPATLFWQPLTKVWTAKMTGSDGEIAVDCRVRSRDTQTMVFGVEEAWTDDKSHPPPPPFYQLETPEYVTPPKLAHGVVGVHICWRACR